MKKSLYSLILMDSVIDEIDKLAYKMNTSRSNLINQILAEHVSLSTPEMIMRDVFTNVLQIMDSTFLHNQTSSDSMLSIRSPLQYKYKPIIRYCIELNRNSSQEIGRLKVSCRTQNENLIELMNNFYYIWCDIEKKYSIYNHQNNISCEIHGQNFIRELKIPTDTEKRNPVDIGSAIGEYIKIFDKAIKIYFNDMNNLPHGLAKIEFLYSEAYNNKLILI